MNEIITEKKYSVQNLWILKSVLGSLFTLIFFIPNFIFSSQTNEINENLEINLYIIIIIGFAFFHLIITILKKINFHYSIGDKFLTLKQGILSKQQRNIPYEVIQNIFVKQDLFDRIFRLSSLTIENASYDTRHLITSKRQLQQQALQRIKDVEDAKINATTNPESGTSAGSTGSIGASPTLMVR